MPDELSNTLSLDRPPALGAAVPVAPRPLPGATTLDAQGAFQGILGRTVGKSSASPEAQARQAAESWVAISFIQPILKQFRESDRTPAPWAPSQAEKQFTALRDADLAQRIAHAQRFPLVDRVARDLLTRASRSAPGSALTPTAIEPPADTHADPRTTDNRR